jgi:hypothetical protein
VAVTALVFVRRAVHTDKCCASSFHVPSRVSTLHVTKLLVDMDRETRKIMPFARALCLCVPEIAVKINFSNGNVREVSSVVIVTRMSTWRPSLMFSGQKKIRLLGG